MTFAVPLSMSFPIFLGERPRRPILEARNSQADFSARDANEVVGGVGSRSLGSRLWVIAAARVSK